MATMWKLVKVFIDKGTREKVGTVQIAVQLTASPSAWRITGY